MSSDAVLPPVPEETSDSELALPVLDALPPVPESSVPPERPLEFPPPESSSVVRCSSGAVQRPSSQTRSALQSLSDAHADFPASPPQAMRKNSCA